MSFFQSDFKKFQLKSDSAFQLLLASYKSYFQEIIQEMEQITDSMRKILVDEPLSALESQSIFNTDAINVDNSRKLNI